MSGAVVIVGTDTGVGKTVFAAGLARALGATYWKPVQAGLETETDSETVSRLSGCPVLAEGYRLARAASPHVAAWAEGVVIDPAALVLPRTGGPLVVEGAGGVMVPLTSETLYLDLIARWSAPVILCARTTLGTINHSLLSLAALREVGCAVTGIVFIGPPEPEVEATICAFGKVMRLGGLPLVPRLSRETLATAFAQHIDAGAIHAELARTKAAR